MQYRQIFTIPRFDLCALLNLTEIVKNNGKVKRVPSVGVYNESFIRERVVDILAGIKKYYPDKFHACPMHRDDLKIYDFPSSYKHAFEEILPDGDYRYERKLFNDDDDNVLTYTIYQKFSTREPSFI